MADMTVTPLTLQLALTQQTITLPGATHISYPTTLALALVLPVPIAVSSFPGLSRKPSHNFSDEPSDDAVLVGSTASGYPVLIKLFTFGARSFTYELRSVSNTDKLTIMEFYETHKDLEFPWYNAQDATWYNVVFVNKPNCRMDGRVDLWRILIMLEQVSLE